MLIIPYIRISSRIYYEHIQKPKCKANINHLVSPDKKNENYNYIFSKKSEINNRVYRYKEQRIIDRRSTSQINMFPKNYCSSNSQISISYSEITTISAIEHKRPKQITKLSIVHSKLESLEGIEKFTSLISLNLKYNNIENAQELMRIPNKLLLKQLSIQGNSIQYFSACTYMSLRRNGFDSLILFNNKDYSKWVKKVKKVPHINKLNEKLGEVQKQMSKTLKRTIRNNVIEKYKLSHQQLEPDQNQETSRLQNSKQQTASSNQRTPFRQISLSNVNMIKSIRADQASPQEKPKIPQLVIEPIQFGLQDQIVNLPLTQPTATFASQKQKETMPFKGRGNHFATEINVISEIDDQYECNYTSQDELNQLSYFRDNANMRQSFSRTRQIGMQNKSALEQLYESVHDKEMWIAECFYLNNLRVKALKALKPKNMPRRVSYV